MGYISLKGNAYHVVPDSDMPFTDIETERGLILEKQRLFIQGFLDYCIQKNAPIENYKKAEGVVFSFLTEEQVGLILGSELNFGTSTSLTDPEKTAISSYIYSCAIANKTQAAVLDDLLKGLIVYQLAFLGNLELMSSRFKNLTAFLDTDVVLKALGLSSDAATSATRSAISMFKDQRVSCVVLEETVQEIQRILDYIEDDVAKRRISDRSDSVSNILIEKGYTRSDVVELNALLHDRLGEIGLEIQPTRKREHSSNAGEEALIRRLEDPNNKASGQNRIRHDVNCIATVLTLRKGSSPRTIEDARYVFLSGSQRVIHNINTWWTVDEGESCQSPIVDFNRFANYAWIKRPDKDDKFQLNNLSSICLALMTPSAALWETFKRNLETMQEHGDLTPEQCERIIWHQRSKDFLLDMSMRGPVDEFEESEFSAGAIDINKQIEDEIAEKANDVAKPLHNKIREYEKSVQGVTKLLKRHEELRNGDRERVARVIYIFCVVFMALLIISAVALLAEITGIPLFIGLAGGILTAAFAVLSCILNSITAFGLIHPRLCRFSDWIASKLIPFQNVEDGPN